jgi:hypothetical protein
MSMIRDWRKEDVCGMALYGYFPTNLFHSDEDTYMNFMCISELAILSRCEVLFVVFNVSYNRRRPLCLVM